MNIPKTGTFKSSFSVELAPSDLSCAALPTLFTMDARYDGSNAPMVSFRLGDLFESLEYDFGGRGEYRRNQWRVPPFVNPAATLRVSVAIPEGTTVSIRSFGCDSQAAAPSWNDGGVRLNAHLGFWGFAPENTLASIQYAAACGYPACIVVPKATKDGVLVCIHDDTINRTARDASGMTVGEAPRLVWDMTYEELREWEVGSFKHPFWRGERIPLLSDFFRICAKTGMRPMFSTHPALTEEQWLDVRQMLMDNGLTGRFNIKSFDPAVLATAHSIFGNEIEGYTLDVGGGNTAASHVATMDAIGFDKNRSRVGIELPWTEITRESVRTIVDAGYFASCWGLSRTPVAKLRELIALGVTEFTDDYNCCAGLDW